MDLPPQSSTSLNQSWGPWVRSFAPVPVQDVVVEKAKLVNYLQLRVMRLKEMPTVPVGPLLPAHYLKDELALPRRPNYEDVIQLRQSLEVQEETRRWGLVTLLSDYCAERHSLHSSQYGTAPFGSALVYQRCASGGLQLPVSWRFGDRVATSASATSAASTSVEARSTLPCPLPPQGVRSPSTVSLCERPRREGFN